MIVKMVNRLSVLEHRSYPYKLHYELPTSIPGIQTAVYYWSTQNNRKMYRVQYVCYDTCGSMNVKTAARRLRLPFLLRRCCLLWCTSSCRNRCADLLIRVHRFSSARNELPPSSSFRLCAPTLQSMQTTTQTWSFQQVQ